MDGASALRVNYDSFSTKMVFRTSKRVGVTMRGLGDTTAYLRRGIREILCLALFFFTFLASEYLFDVRVAEFVPANEVVIYESIVVGASVIGFSCAHFCIIVVPSRSMRQAILQACYWCRHCC